MIDGQSERLNKKKIMKVAEILASDKSEFIECKNDLMHKVSLSSKEAEDVSLSIRDFFLPKLLESEGISNQDFPEDFFVKVTETDDDFTNDCHADAQGESLDFDALTDEAEEDENEIATIHIKVPVDKIEDVENALEDALGDTDADSKDQAVVHKDIDNNGDDMKETNNKDAAIKLRKTILAALEDEQQSVTRSPKFDYNESGQLREEDEQNTFKGNLSDPDYSSLDYAGMDIPVFQTKLDNVGDNLGLNESMTAVKFDGVPEDTDEYEIKFNPFEIPTQGNDELYNEAKIPSEGKVPRKRIVNSSTLGDFDADAAEQILADALRSAGVEEDELSKITYAEGLTLYKAIKTASEKREHYSKDGVMPSTENDPKDPDKNCRESATESALRENSGEEIDPESDHERKNAYSSTKIASDEAYAEMLKKIFRGDSDSRESEKDVNIDSVEEVKVSNNKADAKIAAEKDNELYKARLKTSLASATQLYVAGILPAEEVDSYADAMMRDNLNVKAMINQTKLLIKAAANNEERLAVAESTKNTRVASSNKGISFNPAVRTGGDVVSDIQESLRNIGWTGTRNMGDE